MIRHWGSPKKQIILIATDIITKLSVTKADLNIQVKVAALFQEFPGGGGYCNSKSVTDSEGH